MPISPSGFPALQELSNGEQAVSVVFNRPLFALSTRTESLKTLLEAVESEVVTARDTYPTLGDRLDTMFGSVTSDRNMFVTGGASTWDLGTQTFTHGQITLIQPDNTFNYTINSGSVSSIADGDCLYVTLSRSSGAATLTLTKVAGGSLPTGPDIFAMAVRFGDYLWVRGAGLFEDQETRPFGDGLTDALLGRLEMVSEADTDSHFTNTTIIDIADGIPTAISKHDLELEYQIRDRNTIIHGGEDVSWASGTLSFTQDLKVTVPSEGDVTIAATSIGSIADGELLYFTIDRSTSSYAVTLSKVAAGSLPLSNGNTDNYVVGYRSGTNFIFRSGDVFQDGETKRLGSGGAGLVPYQNNNLYPSSDDDLTWDAAAGTISSPGDIEINYPWASYNNIIPSTELPILLSTSGKKAYVVLDRTQQANLTVVDDVDTIPITYSDPDSLLIAERKGNAVYLFGTHRFNDGDIRRVGEGFVAGAIYDKSYMLPSAMSSVTIPNGQTHGGDDVTMKVWGNGVLLKPTVDYNEGPLDTEITAVAGEMFPDGNFPEDMSLRFRIESIVTGGAGAGGSGGGSGVAWSDPVTASLVPDIDEVRSLGSTTKGWKNVYLSDRSNANVYELYITSGSLQAVLVP